MTATCRVCGATFEVSAKVQQDYPGWTPSRCMKCHRGPAAASAAPDRGSNGSKPRRSSTRRAGTVEENLTLAEVLDRYHDGPSDGVFTDGSSVPNPGPGGWGAVYVLGGEVVEHAHGHDPDTTNNRMELTAIIRGIELVPAGTPTTLYTDSRLCVDTLTQWAAGWERRGWSRKSGPIKNLDLVKEAWALVQSRPEIELAWVKAHAGNRWNEYADALSTAWARDTL